MIEREKNMDDAAYKQWTSLRMRVAKGESLTLEEQAIYEAGERELDAEEEGMLRNNGIEEIRQLQARLASLEQEHSELLERKTQLGAEIAELETQLHPRTRQLLHVGN